MFDPLRDMPDGLKHLADGLSFSILLGALVNLLPSVAAVLTITWTAIRIFETDTVQRLIARAKRRDSQ